jgi:hypothetical protein
MSQNPSAGASPGAGPSPESLVKTIDQIESQLREYQQAQKKTGRIVALGTLAILICLTLFAVSLYNTVTQRFTKETLVDALSNAAQGMEPQIKRQIITAAEEILPLYVQAAQEQISKDWPEIQQKLSAKSNQFPDQVQKLLVTDGQKMLARVEKHLEKTLTKEFPKVTPEKAQQLAQMLINHTALKSEKINDRLEKLSMHELEKLQKVLEKYPINDYAALDRPVLEKKVLRKVVQVIDFELEVHGTKDGLDFEELRKQGIIGSAILGNLTGK